ncbi:MAG: 6-bladed beta-propeller [Gemmatimonadetes bacterium]|nr:6-bladed beta-propeller [Gemmatimonadota bacterium]
MGTTRRQFLRIAAAAGAGAVAPAMASASRPFHIISRRPRLGEEIIGHGDFRYRVERGWADLNPATHPVKNCHEMVMDRRGRLIMITDEPRNNIIIYDKSGALLEAWGHEYPNGHGLTLWNAGGEEFLFITDPPAGRVDKRTLDGRLLLTLEDPRKVGGYEPTANFRPTETAIGPDGTIYVADGYGSYHILRYTPDGKYIDKFGGRGSEDHQLMEPHGVAIDTRRAGTPRLVVTSRQHNSFKYFTLAGEYLETVFLPGAFVCRPVIDGENLYAGVCWSRLRYLNQTPDSGFVTILDRANRVVSNPAGTAPVYEAGELQLMVQALPIFKHCHDVCVDDDKNLYVCQWNAGGAYPTKLHRV